MNFFIKCLQSEGKVFSVVARFFREEKKAIYIRNDKYSIIEMRARGNLILM